MPNCGPSPILKPALIFDKPCKLLADINTLLTQGASYTHRRGGGESNYDMRPRKIRESANYIITELCKKLSCLVLRNTL